jgi:hypothetical protein
MIGSLLTAANTTQAALRSQEDDQRHGQEERMQTDIDPHHAAISPGTHTRYLARRVRNANSLNISGSTEARMLRKFWLGRRDSNPDTQIQSLQSYR